MTEQVAVTHPAPAYLCTSFAALRAAGACTEGYRKLAQHIRDQLAVTPEDYGMQRPIEVATIAKSNGLSDALWVLRNATLSEQGGAKFLRLLACDFAQHVLHIYEAKYPNGLAPRQAIETSRKFAHGSCTISELQAARRAASASAASAASAAYAAASAAYAAAYAAASAAYAAAYAYAYAPDASAYASDASAYASDAARLTEKQWQLDWLLTALAAESALCATTFSEGSAKGNEVAA